MQYPEAVPLKMVSANSLAEALFFVLINLPSWDPKRDPNWAGHIIPVMNYWEVKQIIGN